MVVIDLLSKYVQFIHLCHPYIAITVAKLFVDNVFKLHGMPISIVSDRDPTFHHTFSQEFLNCMVLN